MIKFPKTPHLPWSGGVTADDIIAEDALDIIRSASHLMIQEKMDGANSRILFDGVNEPVIGNREHVLKKGYVKKSTPAKLQFRPMWNWVYDNKHLFEKLAKLVGEAPVVFGEWLYAQHTTKYDKLPSYFFAYDIFVDNVFLDPFEATELLYRAGFVFPPIFEIGLDKDSPIFSLLEGDRAKIKLLSDLYQLSRFSSTDLIEGLYFKVGNGKETTHRFKLLRSDYKTVDNFTERGLIKNGLIK